MTIASEITRIKTNIAGAYTALEEKGAVLPEVQNSANLAETISSITIGSISSGQNVYRDGWLVPQLYLDIDTLVENFNTNANLVKIGSSTTAMGKDTTYIQGVVFTDDVNEIIVYRASGKNKYCIIPEDAIIEEYDSGYYKISFNTDRWFVCDSTLTWQGFPYPITKVNNASYGNSGIFGCYLKYCSVKVIDSSIKLTFPVFYGNCNLDDFHIVGNYTPLQSISYDIIAKYVFLKNSSCLADVYKIPSLTDTSETYSGQLLSYMGNSLANYQAKRLLDYAKFPIILDLSSYTNTSTLMFGRNEEYGSARLKHLKMILPSTCSVALKAENSTWGEPLLDLESYQFIAEHAPTVSDLTFTMGAKPIQFCNANDTTIIETLENKGWTIA